MNWQEPGERLNLFKVHVSDLKRLCPSADNIFLCPICFGIFDERELSSLSIGHVWPEAEFPRLRCVNVLLCADCNNKAGGHGDAAMQEFMEARRAREVKQFFRSCIKVAPSDGLGTRPIPLGTRIPITIDENQLKASIVLQRGKYNPAARSCMENGLITVWVEETYPATERWRMARIGWMTSAYLFAFYRFGYRYILNTYLDHVRVAIKASFDKEHDDSLEFSTTRDTCVWVCENCYEQGPRMEIVIVPQAIDTPQHIKITLQDYHMRLPITLGADYFEPIPAAFREKCSKLGIGVALDCYDPILDDKPVRDKLLCEPDYLVYDRSLELR